MSLLLLGVVLVGLVGTLVGYHGKEWADFKRFNQARTALLSLMGLVTSSMAVEGYLIYRGKLPLRVMLPLFSCKFFP